MEPVNFRMKGDVEGLPLNLQLPPALRQGHPGDPFAILRPALRELVQVESMRLLSAIDDAIWRVDVITAMDQICRNVKVTSAFLGSTLVNLVERYQEIMGSLADLKTRSDIIETLTSYQLMKVYYRGPQVSFQSIDLSTLDMDSIPSLLDVAVPAVEAEPEVDWESIPWRKINIDVVPVAGSSTDTIARIKRGMRAEERRLTLLQTDDGSIDVDSSVGLRTSRSRTNLLSGGSGDGEEEEEEEEEGEDGMYMEMEEKRQLLTAKDNSVDIDNNSLKLEEYVQRVDEIASLELFESQQSLFEDESQGDSLTRVVSLPWAPIPDRKGDSVHAHIDEMLNAKTVRKSLRLVQEQLTMIIRNILRGFRENPLAIDRIIADKQRTDPAQEFIFFLKDLRQLMLHRLLTTPAEDKTKDEYMKEVERRTDGYEKLGKRLSDEIQKVNRDRDDKCREMNDMLRKLQLDIMTVEKLADEYMLRTRQEGEKLCQAELKLSMERRQKPLLQQSDLTAQLSKLRDDHWSSESILRRKKYKVETEIENWITRFDEDMTALQVEFDEVEAAYDVEKAALEEMEDKFEPMESEFKEILQERDVLYRIRMTKEREDLRRYRAVHTIQAWWRSFRVRKAIRIRNQKLEKQRLKDLKKKGKKGKRGKKGKGEGGEKKSTDKKKGKK